MLGIPRHGGDRLFSTPGWPTHGFLRERRCGWSAFLLVGLGAVDVDAVGGGIVGHAEVHGPADIPEPDIVVATDKVGGERCLLAVDLPAILTSVSQPTSPVT